MTAPFPGRSAGSLAAGGHLCLDRGKEDSSPSGQCCLHHLLPQPLAQSSWYGWTMSVTEWACGGQREEAGVREKRQGGRKRQRRGKYVPSSLREDSLHMAPATWALKGIQTPGRQVTAPLWAPSPPSEEAQLWAQPSSPSAPSSARPALHREEQTGAKRPFENLEPKPWRL